LFARFLIHHRWKKSAAKIIDRYIILSYYRYINFVFAVSSDKSKASYTIKARELRNEVKHLSSHQISTELQFEFLWQRIKLVVQKLLYHSSKDLKKFKELKKGSLENYGPKAADIVAQRIVDVENDGDNNLLENLKQIHEVVEGLKNQCLSKFFERNYFR